MFKASLFAIVDLLDQHKAAHEVFIADLLDLGLILEGRVAPLRKFCPVLRADMRHAVRDKLDIGARSELVDETPIARPNLACDQRGHDVYKIVARIARDGFDKRP